MIALLTISIFSFLAVIQESDAVFPESQTIENNALELECERVCGSGLCHSSHIWRGNEVSPDGSYLIFLSQVILDANGKVVHDFRRAHGFIRRGFLMDGRCVSLEMKATLGYFDIESGKTIGKFSIPTEFESATLAPDKIKMYCFDSAGTIYSFQYEGQEDSHVVQKDTGIKNPFKNSPNSHLIDWSRNNLSALGGERLLVKKTSYGDQICALDMRTGNVIFESAFESIERTVCSADGLNLAFVRDGHLIVQKFSTSNNGEWLAKEIDLGDPRESKLLSKEEWSSYEYCISNSGLVAVTMLSNSGSVVLRTDLDGEEFKVVAQSDDSALIQSIHFREPSDELYCVSNGELALAKGEISNRPDFPFPNGRMIAMPQQNGIVTNCHEGLFYFSNDLDTFKKITPKEIIKTEMAGKQLWESKRVNDQSFVSALFHDGKATEYFQIDVAKFESKNITQLFERGARLWPIPFSRSQQNGNFLATLSPDARTVQVIDMSTAKEIQRYSVPRNQDGFSNKFDSFDVSRDHEIVGMVRRNWQSKGVADQFVAELFDKRGKKIADFYADHWHDIAISPDGKTAAISNFGYLSVFDLATRKRIMHRSNNELELHGRLSIVSYSLDGKLIALTDSDGLLSVLDCDQNTIIGTSSLNVGEILALSWSTDRIFITTGDDGSLRRWRVTRN